MSITELKPLFELTLSYISEKLFNNLHHHLGDDNCQICELPWNVEMCPVLKATREQLTSLPVPIIESIFNKISLSVSEENVRISAKYLFAYSYILEFRDVKIDFSLFLVNYEKYIQTLHFESKPIWENCWSSTPRTSSNITVLNLQCVVVNDLLLEAIGQHCEQISRIQGICIDENVTETSFKKLCFRNYVTSGESFKNACCETIKYFDIEYSEFDIMDEQTLASKNRMDAIVFLLLKNLLNLISFGHCFKVDCYLSSRPISFQTNLEDIALNKLSDETISLVKHYCPKIKKLLCYASDETLSSYPHSFLPCLNEIDMSLFSLNSEVMYELLKIPMWSLTKHLHLSIEDNSSEINLSKLAKYFPVLESLNVLCGNVKWDGKYSFNCLSEVIISFSSETMTDTSWILSFSGTIKFLNICGCRHSKFNENFLNSLLIASFPKLESLHFSIFEYNFKFVTNVISTIPSLRKVILSTCIPPITTEQRSELKQFIKDNNYDCRVHLY